MARRFRGESEQTVDGKGRVSVPALFRRVIEACDPDWSDGQRPNLVIVYGGESQKRLDCYTMEAIEQIDRQIDKMQKGSRERKMLERLFHGFSTPAQVVEDGRIVLPVKLRKKLDLEDKAFFIAAGDHFEIWKPETFEAEEQSKADQWLAEQDEDFDPMSLLPSLDD
ncbi:MAG: division/cell wall cluster transcriptional repressor MraZ [Paracoccaceae bacterium]